MILPNCRPFWIARPIKRRALIRQARAFDARSAVGRLAKTINGLVLAGTRGTRSTREECAPLACTSGLRPSVFPALVGRRIRTGMRSDVDSEGAGTTVEAVAKLSRIAGKSVPLITIRVSTRHA